MLLNVVLVLDPKAPTVLASLEEILANWSGEVQHSGVLQEEISTELFGWFSMQPAHCPSQPSKDINHLHPFKLPIRLPQIPCRGKETLPHSMHPACSHIDATMP